jgi:hypothetical protein
LHARPEEDDQALLYLSAQPCPFPGHGRVADVVVALVHTLNALPRASRPWWCSDATDATLRAAGVYDPSRGLGIPEEWDAGNEAGSALMLAMLQPEHFGVPGSPVLEMFGIPPPSGILNLSNRSSQSGRGPDNRRTNIIEGLLNHWQHDDALQEVRQQLRHAWYVARLAMEATSLRPRIVADIARDIFAAPDSIVDDLEVDTCEFAFSVGMLVECRFEICSQSTSQPKVDDWLKSGKAWMCKTCQQSGLSPVHVPTDTIPSPSTGGITWTKGGIWTVSCNECQMVESFLHNTGVRAGGWSKYGKHYCCKQCTASFGGWRQAW